jgi:hypothetical protein
MRLDGHLGRLTASLSGMTRMSEMIGEHPACLIMMDGWPCRCKLSVLTLAVVLTKKAKHDRRSVLSSPPPPATSCSFYCTQHRCSITTSIYALALQNLQPR